MTELRFESRLSEIQMSSCLVSLLGWSHGDVQQSPWGSAGPSREFTGRRVKACPWTQSVGHSGFALFPSTFSFQVRAHLLEHRAARRKLKTVAPTSWITDSVEVMSLCEHLYCPFFISILSLIWSRRVVKYYFQLVKDSNHCILPLYENTVMLIIVKKFLWASCVPQTASIYVETNGFLLKWTQFPSAMIITLYNQNFPLLITLQHDRLLFTFQNSFQKSFQKTILSACDINVYIIKPLMQKKKCPLLSDQCKQYR